MEGNETTSIGPVDIDWINLTRTTRGVIGVAGVFAGDADAPGGEDLPVRDKGSIHFHAAEDGCRGHIEVRRGVVRIPVERDGIVEQPAGKHGLAIHFGQCSFVQFDQGGLGSQGGASRANNGMCFRRIFKLLEPLWFRSMYGKDCETTLASKLAGKRVQVGIRL